ncbi:hypothetical protein [Parasediminibacterium sp. JCM 36343]|uniref:hypothetical protein n=1 Tax=Parasediminibacterium sp. JCM 36343 TaxID=3374279 RepID=UPI00397AF8AA
MKKRVLFSFGAILYFTSIYAQVPPLAAPPQDDGLPYTHSARPKALSAIANTTAIFAGSKYAYLNGYRIRLDTKDILRAEAVLKNGKVFIPLAFAAVLAQKEIHPKPIPKGLEILEDRWVYEVSRENVTLPASIETITVKGATYFDAAAYSKSLSKQVYQTKRGLLLISNNKINYNENDKVLDDCVVTLFDTPEKFADPDIATQYIPTLKRQGKWTDFVKVTPEQQKVLDGPETDWQFTPASKYDYTGFNTRLLGSKVPAPGIYPRILFSEADIPMLAERIMSSKLGQKSMIEVEYLLKHSWWDESTSDGKVFKQLYSGNLAVLQWPEGNVPNAPPSSVPHQFKDEKAGIYNSHVSYVPECLTDMALYCLLTNDDVHGRQAAAAIANYFKLREPLIEEWVKASDSELATSYTKPDGTKVAVGGNGAATAWRNIHGVVAHMNLGLSLDFAGKWMTTEEKELMRRVIAKATYGRRGYGQDGPLRFRDINWVAWDLPNFLAVTAIEGLDGFDKESYESNCETVKAFCEWGIDDSGVIYESNGKTPGGMQFHTLAMIALARRGDNLWGHPHVRKLLHGQVMMTSPDGKVVVNSGTQYVPFSQSYFSLQTIDEYKSFYPGDLSADYLLSQPTVFGDKNDEYQRGWMINDFDANKYKRDVANVKRLRMPSPMYPGFVPGLLYDTDFKLTTREDLNLPLNFNAPTHGVFSSYSDASLNATWINMMVRPDHYLGGGHHHADAGMFHFSALGVDWITESPFPQVYDGKYHNQVLVDGESEPEGASGLGTGYQAAATYIGEASNDNAGFATADLTNSYTYRWQTQPGAIWEDKLKVLNWELDPSPQNLKMFAGTSRYKMRPWWATYNYSNYIATSRALFNPMEYVYRSAGLVRGKHSYGVVVDDLKKDGQEHLYQWTAMLNGGVWQASVKGIPKNQIVLAKRDYDVKANTGKAMISPKNGEPLLLVAYISDKTNETDALPLMQVSTEVGPPNSRIANTQFYDRLAVNTKSVKANYKVLLIPFKYGEELPVIATENGKTTVTWKDGQKDVLLFSEDASKRTKITVQREGKVILESKK